MKVREEDALLFLLFDVTTLKMAWKSMKLQQENPAGYAGEGNMHVQFF